MLFSLLQMRQVATESTDCKWLSFQVSYILWPCSRSLQVAHILGTKSELCILVYIGLKQGKTYPHDLFFVSNLKIMKLLWERTLAMLKKCQNTQEEAMKGWQAFSIWNTSSPRSRPDPSISTRAYLTHIPLPVITYDFRTVFSVCRLS